MYLEIFSTVSIVIVLYIISKIYNWKCSKYPPGPLGIPLFGNLISLGTMPHLTLANWTKKYGPIISVRMGDLKVVCLNDIKTIKDGFNQTVFSGRPDNKGFNYFAGGKYGIINADSTQWIQQRRFALRTLRDFGFGKKSMENLILEDVDEFINWLAKSNGEPISVGRTLSIVVFNSLWMIIAGRRYDINDDKLRSILDLQAKNGKELMESGLLLFFPKLAQVFPNLLGWNKMVQGIDPLRHLFNEVVEEHKATYSRDTCRDFIDCYLQEIENTEDPESSFHKDNVSDKAIRAVVADFFIAGTDTSSATLHWIILYLMTSVHIQRKLQKEIDGVVGKSRTPTLLDKPLMPYCEAVIMESLRLSAIVPIGVFHNTMEDTTFHGFDIPKDTIIMSNLHNALHDPTVWKDPKKFIPERFLTEDERSIVKHESFIPFSTGKRQCPGETLARDQLFLFVASIFQRFDVSPDPENPKPSMEPELQFVLKPQPYKAVFKERY